MRKNDNLKPKSGNPYAYTVLQNLKDAGCSDEMSERFMALEDNEEQQLKLLFAHRKRLLDELHCEERRIDCLDYLIFQMQNKK